MAIINNQYLGFENQVNELNQLLDDLDLDHPDAHMALGTILMSWGMSNNVPSNVLGPVLNELAFDQTLDGLLEVAIEFMGELAESSPDLDQFFEKLVNAYEGADEQGNYFDTDLISSFGVSEVEEKLPELIPGVDIPEDSNTSNLQYGLTEEEKLVLPPGVLVSIVGQYTPQSTPAPIQDSSGSITVQTTTDGQAQPNKPGMITIQTLEEIEESTPSREPSVVDSFIEDIATFKGIAVLTSEEWRASKMARNIPVLVKNFDFKAVERPDLGKASYLLVGPKSGQDVRIELRAQVVSGSAGDKLPVLVHKLHSLQQSREYGQTVVGIVGDTSFYSKYALDLARQVAASSGLVVYAEGDTPVTNALDTAFDNVISKFTTLSAQVSSPAASFDNN